MDETPASTASAFVPDITVATVVIRDGRVLLVEENVQGRVVLNQPAGHLERGESLQRAALRETLEETAWHIELTAFIGSYQWTSPHDGRCFLRFAFAARPLVHEPQRPLDDGILRCLWLTPSELLACDERHRSPLVAAVVEDYLAGRRMPLDLVRAL